MITFPFFCPACQQVANTKADPVGLLFGGASDLALTCEECGAMHRAVVEFGAVGQTVKLKGPLTPEDTEE